MQLEHFFSRTIRMHQNKRAFLKEFKRNQFDVRVKFQTFIY